MGTAAVSQLRQTVRVSLITRPCHSVASKHVGPTGLWLQEALENRKLELEKMDPATDPADVCTKALPGNRIRELSAGSGVRMLQ